jgi:hypothetical protein
LENKFSLFLLPETLERPKFNIATGVDFLYSEAVEHHRAQLFDKKIQI